MRMFRGSQYPFVESRYAVRPRSFFGRVLIGLVILADPSGFGSGCSEPVEPAHCNGACVEDPVDHCVTSVCASSTDCPAGLACLPVHLDSRAAPPEQGTLAGPFTASSDN